MDKNMEERIIAVANYIVDNKATIIQTAEHFNMSPSSIKKYINSKDKLQSIDIELFKKVKEAQMSVIIDGQIKGGKIGSREGVRSISEEKLTYIMDEMIEKDHGATAICHFCCDEYHFTEDELREIEKEARES